jgi:hypothetical protein
VCGVASLIGAHAAFCHTCVLLYCAPRCACVSVHVLRQCHVCGPIGHRRVMMASSGVCFGGGDTQHLLADAQPRAHTPCTVLPSACCRQGPPSSAAAQRRLKARQHQQQRPAGRGGHLSGWLCTSVVLFCSTLSLCEAGLSVRCSFALWLQQSLSVYLCGADPWGLTCRFPCAAGCWWRS